MSFLAIPVTTGNPTTGYSTPNRVSFCVQDDGGGGQLCVNGLGITTVPALDLKTLFGSAFRSEPLLRAFRAVGNSALNAMADQFNTYLNFSSVFINSQGPAGSLAVVYLMNIVSAPPTVPFFAIGSPGVAGIWRVDLQLRHSIPG